MLTHATRSGWATSSVTSVDAHLYLCYIRGLRSRKVPSGSSAIGPDKDEHLIPAETHTLHSRCLRSYPIIRVQNSHAQFQIENCSKFCLKSKTSITVPGTGTASTVCAACNLQFGLWPGCVWPFRLTFDKCAHDRWLAQLIRFLPSASCD